MIAGSMTSPPTDSPHFLQQSIRILDSYRHWFGEELICREGVGEDQALRLFHCDKAILSTGIEPDPVLNYGNQLALTLWEMSWEDFTRMPGRLTAEPPNQAARDTFLRQVREQGFINNYEGIRISRTGRRFRISGARIWNILDGQGSHLGQAAAVSRWDSSTGRS
jgi:hypothetical protein